MKESTPASIPNVALNFEGAIRVSPLHCHTCEEIDEFLRITAEIAAL